MKWTAKKSLKFPSQIWTTIYRVVFLSCYFRLAVCVSYKTWYDIDCQRFDLLSLLLPMRDEIKTLKIASRLLLWSVEVSMQILLMKIWLFFFLHLVSQIYREEIFIFCSTFLNFNWENWDRDEFLFLLMILMLMYCEWREKREWDGEVC